MESEVGSHPGTETQTLLVLQPKSFRSFNNKDEYLYAMKEDLADWFTCLYKIEINGDIFFEVIETGILLCHHANEVINFTKERKEKGIEIIMKSYFVTKIPENLLQYKDNVKPGSFLARDNISNFISWCRILGIPDDLRFETEDLVTRKNEKSVILCLLEVARVGAKLGMLAPTIVQMEEEIDAELAGEPPAQIITCDLKSLDEMVCLLIGYCTCPVQFPMVKVGDGKYQVGASRTLIFVRILRKHVMVRVGGGWDTLERYLDKHDPCRCHYPGHRGSSGQNGIATPSQKIPPRRMSTPNTVPSPHNITSTRRVSSVNNTTPSKTQVSNSRCKSPGPANRSKSPSPGSQRLPTPQLSMIPQHVETSKNNIRSQISRRSLSPGPIRSHSPGPSLVPGRTRTLPQTPGQRTVSSSTRSSTPKGILNKTFNRQKSVGAAETEDMETENGEKVTLDEIKTMTLEDFKNLLNSNLSVPIGASCTSQNSDSPRSQESSDSYRSKTKSFVRHGKDSEKGPSWRNVREKARNVYDSVSAQNYQKNVNNNRVSSNSNNDENSRPKTPTSNWRPKTPTSGIKSVYACPKTPTSRPKTPSSMENNNNSSNSSRPSTSRSSEEDLTYRGYIRTPSKASSYSSLDDEESSEVANIIGCGTSRSSKESSPAESIDKQVPLRSRTPGISGIPRPSTPASGIPRVVTSASSSRPTTPRMARKQSLPDGSQKGISISRPTTPAGKPEKTYASLYQAKRSKTPGPSSERSQIPGADRSITPGPRESWQKPPLNKQPSTNSLEGERRTRNVSRSLDFSRQRSKSVVDIVCDEDNEPPEPMVHGGEDVTTDDSRSRLKNKMLALAEKRRRSTSSGPKTFSRQEASDKNDILIITRGKGGGHSVTVGNNGSTTYQSRAPVTPKSVVKSKIVNGKAEGNRARSKTPDPGMCNGRTRLIDPKLMTRRNSGGVPSQAVDKRLEAWVDSTVNENKRKIPSRPKRSMTPNSMEFTEKDLEPRPFEEIKAALEKPINGIINDTKVLPPPPEDPEMFHKMEKLFAKYREMELQASENNTPAMCPLNVNTGDGEELFTNDCTSIMSSKSNSSPSGQSLHSNNWSWTNSGSSRSSGSPAPVVSTLTVGSIFNPNQTSTPCSQTAKTQHVELSDLNSSVALVSKMKEVLKVRPRNEPKSGPRTRIPAPSISHHQRSKSVTNLNSSCDYSTSAGSKTDTDSAYENSVNDYSDNSNELSELSQMTARFCDDSALDLNRSETPVPKLATPLITGRSTVISKSNSSTRLVRANSQEPVDHSRSNSMSSLSSRLSVSNPEDEMDYV